MGYRHYRLLTIDENAALVVVDLDQRMSGLGHSLQKRDVRMTSAFPLIATE